MLYNNYIYIIVYIIYTYVYIKVAKAYNKYI